MVDEREEQETRDEAVPKPEAPPAEEPQSPEGLRARLDEEKAKAQDYLANWQRAAADYQNLKRRMEQERGEVGRLATASLIINLLPLVDDLERALRNVDTKLAGLTWIDGIWLIDRKFQAVLENAGVQEIPAEGQTFDPNVHEAISQVPGDEGKVISVVQKGYKLGDRVIRPAMVVVGSSASAAAGEQGTGNKEQGEDAPSAS
jgi:molecular chaperone GrpE